MAGIYIHIPFCKQACYYCDFHFSTSLKKKEELLLCIHKELEIRSKELNSEVIETIYFGGGTPSILNTDEINKLINTVYTFFKVVAQPEITLEANPDDLSTETIKKLSQSKVNRLSIGVQSFFDQDLQLMNRAHCATEALQSIKDARRYFDNISVDLIYGIPNMSQERWLQNIKTVLELDIPHISSYALTVEKKTALHKLIKEGKIPALDETLAQQHFLLLMAILEKEGYIHYETSNFAKQGYFSKNNSAYWLGKKYLGVGPSAHSFDGAKRSWNISNNTLYIKAIEAGNLPLETELLSKEDRYNEYIMTGLRTIWGVDLEYVEQEFGSEFSVYLNHRAQRFLDDNLLQLQNNILTSSPKGKFLSDGIASDLFYLPLIEKV